MTELERSKAVAPRKKPKYALKPCKNCGGPKEPGVRNHWCKACRELTKDFRRGSETMGQREWRYQKRYGITVEEYNQMTFDQDGVCAICKKECSTGRRLAIDHCHATGKVRGLLCWKCNQALGSFDDSPENCRRAATYLERA